MSGKLGRLNAVIALLNDVKTMQSKVKWLMTYCFPFC